MRLLLLAGTTDARRIAEGLRDAPGLKVIASLAGATRAPRPMGVDTRIGGFGGRAGFVGFLEREGIGAVLDATHPFADAISHRTHEVCAAHGLPCLQVLRPPWVAQPGDCWVDLAREEEAAEHVPHGARVFLATGRQTLERFANLSRCDLTCRQIDPPEAPFPFANGRFLVGRPPFSVQDEVALFRELKIDWLIVKNAGGDASRSKLDAARELGLPVGMIRRPPQPGGARVETVAQALDWARALVT
nr:cobalt-precorrin-6A reductase [Oceaniglobus trochenteri]